MALSLSLLTVLRPAQEFFTYFETSGLQNFSLCFWTGRDLYRATPAVTRDLGFSGLIRRTSPYLVASYNTRGCGGSILTRILTGLQADGSIESKAYKFYGKNSVSTGFREHQCNVFWLQVQNFVMEYDQFYIITEVCVA
jgi:hypothetical protein